MTICLNEGYGNTISKASRWRLRRAPRVPYFYNPDIIERYENGSSIREIAHDLGIGKAHVEKNLRDPRNWPRQLGFRFRPDES